MASGVLGRARRRRCGSDVFERFFFPPVSLSLIKRCLHDVKKNVSLSSLFQTGALNAPAKPKTPVQPKQPSQVRWGGGGVNKVVFYFLLFQF